MFEYIESPLRYHKEKYMSDCITAFEYEGGIVALDSGMVQPLMIACYLLETDDAVALIEVGCNASVERILKVLESRGRRPDEVSHVVVTHVHLDHAGGAGELMARMPNAQFVVHPFGARHMTDPSRLEASARGVYGDEAFDAMYGTLKPISPERVLTMEDGDSLLVGNRPLYFMDTPGHARHHFCIWDEQTKGWFTGDTFGLSYRLFDTENGALIFPTTTPVQFDPEPLKTSIDRLMEKSPKYMYLTHFGRVQDVQRLAVMEKRAIQDLVEIAEQHAGAENRTQAIETDMMEWLLSGVLEHGVSLPESTIREILQDDVVLNTQGIEFWLDHRDQAG
jgi:glyoxylase-like metal-dependent hydrolase (beta-lactamase superfamily II)